jgi:hypothetical protein
LRLSWDETQGIMERAVKRGLKPESRASQPDRCGYGSKANAVAGQDLLGLVGRTAIGKDQFDIG